MIPQSEALFAVLLEVRSHLEKPGNDFSWSGWESSTEALAELDPFIEALRQNEKPRRASLEFLFLPTGPIQEVSLSSGWGNTFTELADRFDQAVVSAYATDNKSHEA